MKQEDFLEKVMAQQQEAIQEEIEHAKQRARRAPKPNGKCLYCDEPVSKGRRFCDADCAQDAERAGIV